MDEKTIIDELLDEINAEIDKAMSDPPAPYFTAGLRKAREIICNKFGKKDRRVENA